MLRQILYNEGASPASAIYRWGMLTVILALIGWNIQIEMASVEFNWRHLGRGLIVPAMLLFNHLAFAFRWPGLLGFAMNVLAFGWIIIGGFLVFYRF
ncbi:MAG: hypothetical protein QM680_13155 [Luteolibacter sp.]